MIINLVDADNSLSVTTNGTDGVYVWGAQLEDITGRADQTTPSEYVSVGVLSAPYHGAGIDGAEFFDTDLDGNPLTTLDGISLEGAGTNLCPYSSYFTGWTAVGTPTLTANAVTIGSLSLSLVGDDDGAATEGYYQPITFTGDGTKVVSIFVKEGTSPPAAGTWFYLYDSTAAANRAFGTITWSSGVPSVAMTDGTLLSSTLISGGVYRIVFSAPSVVAANANRLYLIVSGTAADTGNIYAGGAQAENATFASSLISTTTLAGARNADVLTYPSSGNVSTTTGWCYAEIHRITSVVDTANTAVYVGFGNPTGLLLVANRADTVINAYDGTSIPEKTGLSSMSSGSKKRALTWGGSTQLVTGDGATPASAAFDGSMAPAATISIGTNSGGTQPAYANIKNVRIGQRQLSASEIQAITQ